MTQSSLDREKLTLECAPHVHVHGISNIDVASLTKAIDAFIKYIYIVRIEILKRVQLKLIKLRVH